MDQRERSETSTLADQAQGGTMPGREEARPCLQPGRSGADYRGRTCRGRRWFHVWEPFRSVSLIGVLGVLIGGWPIFKEAAENAAARRMTMELSMSIAIVAAAGIFAILYRAHHHVVRVWLLKCSRE